MSVTHVMLDLETWGTAPGCDIRSIGACVFDPVGGYVAGWDAGADGGFRDALGDTFYIATSNPRGYWGSGINRERFYATDRPSDRLMYPLKRDSKTEQWWSEQSAEAQAAFENPVDLRIALSRFSVWLVDVCPNPSDLRLWAHGPVFDVSILAAAYEAVGDSAPWHYRSPRDTRTAFDMAGIVDHSGWLKQHPGPLGVPHHALDDAISQARAVCGAWAHIQSYDREFHVGRIAMQQYADWTNQAIDIGGAWRNIELGIHEGAR